MLGWQSLKRSSDGACWGVCDHTVTTDVTHASWRFSTSKAIIGPRRSRRGPSTIRGGLGLNRHCEVIGSFVLTRRFSRSPSVRSGLWMSPSGRSAASGSGRWLCTV